MLDQQTQGQRDLVDDRPLEARILTVRRDWFEADGSKSVYILLQRRSCVIIPSHTLSRGTSPGTSKTTPSLPR